jgi:hypothetical protein
VPVLYGVEAITLKVDVAVEVVLKTVAMGILASALLALYGHMLYVGGSPGTAHGYYYRAYVAPDDPALNLCHDLCCTRLPKCGEATARGLLQLLHRSPRLLLWTRYERA